MIRRGSLWWTTTSQEKTAVAALTQVTLEATTQPDFCPEISLAGAGAKPEESTGLDQSDGTPGRRLPGCRAFGSSPPGSRVVLL